MSSSVARQPIFTKSMKIYGYELFYRSHDHSVSYTEQDGDRASSETIINTFHSIGIEKVTGGHRAFVHFTERLLLANVATILPTKILIIELSGLTPTPTVLAACKTIKKLGYPLALDSSALNPANWELLAIADIVKVDMLNTPPDKVKVLASDMRKAGIIMMAQKVESLESYNLAVSLGFSLFQGYFFSTPVIVESGAVSLTPLRISCIELIRLANSENVNYAKMSAIIKQDVALTYRLFRVVNSAFFGLRYKVKNVRQALAILGMTEVKKWVTLISLSEITDAKPDELIRMSLIRGRFLESVGKLAGLERHGDDLYMLGMMSLMDAIMDMNMADIVEKVNLSPNIADPLITHDGTYGELLTMIIHYEKGEWDDAFAIAERYKISLEALSARYLAAIEWASNYR